MSRKGSVSVKKEKKRLRSYEEIEKKIASRDVSVLTAEEFKARVESDGLERTAKEVDVVTTGTFGAMCSSAMRLMSFHCRQSASILPARASACHEPDASLRAGGEICPHVRLDTL
mgnify:CR=1 FL=1